MKNIQFITFGGGCFWGVEKFLQDTPGVIDAVSGYAGGESIDPTYSDVCGGRTGHAEVVNVEFDADIISLNALTKSFMARYGTSSSRNTDQKEIIEKILNDENSSKKFTTQIVALDKFYPAEDYHQDYHGSCRVSA
jgi:peptide-methionine (S)-S-oxide reductase